MFNRLRPLVYLSLLCVLLLSVSCSKKSIPQQGADQPLTTQDIKAKYAGMIAVSPKDIKNEPAYRFIDTWMGTPYRYGGTSKLGIDCSAFTQRFYEEVYHTNLPRTTVEQITLIKKKKMRKLKEGDLVFFTFGKKRKNDHVGIYLQNGYFVHASSAKGVTISNLQDKAYKEKYCKGGRVNRNR